MRHLFDLINKETFFILFLFIFIIRNFIKIILNNSNMSMTQRKFLPSPNIKEISILSNEEEAQHLTWIRTFWLECMDCFLCPWEKSPLASLTLIWGNVLSSNNIIWYNGYFWIPPLRFALSTLREKVCIYWHIAPLKVYKR